MTEFPCEAVLFDCDGVLVDSNAAVLDAWTRWADELGLPADAVLEVIHGQRSADTVAQFVPAERRAAARARIDGLELESAATVTAVPGATALSGSIPRARWAVVTSGLTVLARARLVAAGVVIPEVIVCAEDVSRGKPDPEGYLLAAERLGVPAAAAIVLEDAPAGIAAARAAGVRAVIGVGERAHEAAPDGWVNDLRGLRWTGDGFSVGP